MAKAKKTAAKDAAAEKETGAQSAPVTKPAQDGVPTPPKVSGPVITVQGPKQGRWRAGRHFGAEPVQIPVDELSAKDIAAMEADPLLAVSTGKAEQE